MYQVYDPTGANVAEAETCRGAMNAVTCLAAERDQDLDRFWIRLDHDEAPTPDVASLVEGGYMQDFGRGYPEWT